MGDIPGLVKISVSLKIQPNDGAVYFKVDGQRFGQNRTIKLLTGAKYKIEVSLRPGTVQATTMGIGGVNVPLEEKSRDAQVASYTGIYDTEGVPHTKSGERQPIQVNMQFNDIGVFETVWQVKFYNYHKRDHCQWGNSFGSIEYECKPNETRSLIQEHISYNETVKFKCCQKYSALVYRQFELLPNIQLPSNPTESCSSNSLYGFKSLGAVNDKQDLKRNNPTI
ncbi:hypothetical protein IHE44_0008819, partial [Lamprotornis superbus]